MSLERKLVKRMIETILLIDAVTRYGDEDDDFKAVIDAIQYKLEKLGYMGTDLHFGKVIYYWSPKCYEEFGELIEKYS